MMDFEAWFEVLGRFHPVVLHLPFGVAATLAVWEIYGFWKGKDQDVSTRSLLTVLLVATTSAAGATGWVLGQDPNFENERLITHNRLGIALVIVGFAVALCARLGHLRLYAATLAGYITLMAFTGHFGGSMTHGEDFLFAPLNQDEASSTAPVAPEHQLIQQRCGACHSNSRRKGDLSLSTIEDMTASVVISKDPAASELVRRLRLPLGHKQHMPPPSKTQLTASEVTAIEGWIADGLPREGSGFEITDGYPEKPRISSSLRGRTPKQNELIRKLRDIQVHIETIDPATQRLWVDTGPSTKINPQVLVEMLEGLGGEIDLLSLRSAPLDEEAMALVGTLEKLRELNLAKSNVSVASLALLKGCKALRKLDLTKTLINDEAVESISDLTQLERVYVWNTKITKNGILRLRRQRSDLTVVDGRDLLSDPIEIEPEVVLHEKVNVRPQLGRQSHRYEWTTLWLKLPEGQKELGNTHGGIVVDRRGRVYFNTDSDQAVMVFDAEGHFLQSWGKELGPGLHGMQWSLEDGEEYLYLAHTHRHLVAKATLSGEILWRLSAPMESGKYERKDQFQPTSVVVAPNGGLFVADGYGKHWIHQYDAKRRYLRSFGGPGDQPGQFNTPHGLWIDTRGESPELLVADRENKRLQRFDLKGKWLGTIEGMLRRPCQIQQRGGDLVIADLAGRVTILDRNNKLIAHLGDNPDPTRRANNGVHPDDWRDGEFIAPHSATWDADGNLYIMDWNRHGRISKLMRIVD